LCTVSTAPNCLRRSTTNFAVEGNEIPYSDQASIGVQRQFGTTMSLEADYVYSQGRHEKDIIDNMNLTYNPATGANYPFSDIARRAYPDYGNISMLVRMGRSSYHALQTAITKRLSRKWQGSATYTLSGLWDAFPPAFSGTAPVPFPTAADLGGEWSLSSADLRHRAVFNGIWQVGRGFQVSGIYYVGIGERASTIYGSDLRGLSGVGGPEAQVRLRLRPDGSIVPRNSFTQPTRSKADFRVQQRLTVGRIAIDGIAEVFNVFNSSNFTINTTESNRDFGKAIAGENRTAQVGFRVAF
jgi:hypothetical protein